MGLLARPLGVRPPSGRRRPPGRWCFAAAATTAAFLAGSAPRSAASIAPTSADVDVSVATVWTSPTSPRTQDRPALANPVAMRTWTRSLTTTDRIGLIGRVQTQVLYGERVLVLRRSGAWDYVAVPDQPSPKDPRGYPGWIPAAQVASADAFGRAQNGQLALVTRPTAWLTVARQRIELSYGTRLPLVSRSTHAVLVRTPRGQVGHLAPVDVTTYRSPSAVPAPTGTTIVAAARMFLGVRYLWGGTSAFGLDCSGLLELTYRAHGTAIPRDADAQAAAGTPVSRAALRPGDLIFYGHPVSHVALYTGGSMMIEAPNSAAWVWVTPLRSDGYAGARRYGRT